MALEKKILSELATRLPSNEAIYYLEHMRPLVLPAIYNDIDNALALVYKRINTEQSIDVYNAETVFKHVCTCVSAITGIPDVQHSSTRVRAEVMARYYVMFFTLLETEAAQTIKLTKLASMFSRKYSHCNVIYARSTVKALYQTDKDVHSTMLQIATALSIMGYTRSLQYLNTLGAPFISKTSNDV
jgi:hypothetical protein